MSGPDWKYTYLTELDPPTQIRQDLRTVRDTNKIFHITYFIQFLYMSPAKWSRQAEWIEIANIHFF